jgi:hypothetical protein
MPQLIYRISTSNPPDDDEYLTYEEQGRTFDRENPEEVQMSQGLSVLISLEAARKRIRGRPWKGVGFIAVYELPDDMHWTLEQTTRKLSYYTLWCDGVQLRNCLKEVLPSTKEHEDV